MVTKGTVALLYHAPGQQREFNAFVLDKSFYGPYDDTTAIDWTDDSRSVLLPLLSLLWDRGGHVSMCPQVFCGGQQRHVHLGVWCRALVQPHLLQPGGTQRPHRGLLL